MKCIRTNRDTGRTATVEYNMRTRTLRVTLADEQISTTQKYRNESQALSAVAEFLK